MSLKLGATGKVLYAKENSWGSAVTPNKVLDYISEFKPGRAINLDAKYAVGSGRDPALIRQGVKSYEGSFSGLFSNEALVYYALGSVNTTDNGDGTYTHTVTPANELPSMTIEAGIEGLEIYQIVGAVLDSLTLEAESGEYVSVSGDYIAKDTSVIGSFSGSGSLSALPFEWSGVSVKIDGSDVTQNIGKVTIEIKNNVEGINVVGSDTIGAIGAGTFEPTITLEVVVPNSTLLGVIGVEKTIEITFTRSANDYVKFIAVGVCGEPDLSISAEDLVGASLPFVIKSLQAEVKSSSATLE